MSELIIRSSVPDPARAYLSPGRVLATLVRHRDLIWQFASREVIERHKGAYLGAAWNVISPLLSLGIYTFVFGFVFHSRWQEAIKTHSGGGNMHLSGAFILPFFLGHSIFHFFAECLNRSPGLVASRPNLVKKVVFPLEILPVVGVLSSLVYPLISIACLLVVQVILTGMIPVTTLLLPIVFLPLIPLCLGIGWVLSALGVYIRDIRHITVVLTQLSMFLTPVFYSVDRVPERFRGVYMMNPMAIVIESARSVMLWGEQPDWKALGALSVFSLFVMQAGYVLFMRARRGLNDAI